MELTEIARRRLLTQRLITETFMSPVDAVRWFGAVQSQEYEWSKWALGLRVKGSTTSAIDELIKNGSIVRSWPMRGTVHMMASEDVRWMLELMAYRQNERSILFLKKMGITEEILLSVRPVLEKELAYGPIERRKLYEILELAGILSDRTWGTHIVGYWSQAGLICPGPLNGKQPTVALLDIWVPREKSLILSKQEALKMIAERYFQSHGPASLQDFVWWTGLSTTDAAEGLETIKSSIVSRESEGKTLWMSKETAEAEVGDVPSAHVLPPFDEYTIAYKNRDAAIAATDLQSMQHGIFKPNVLVDGRIVGFWSRKIQKNDISAEIATKPLKPAQKKQLLVKIEDYSRFMGLPVQTEFKTI